MIKLTIDNSTSIITGLTSVQFAELRDQMSCLDEMYGIVGVTKNNVHRLTSGPGGVYIRDSKGRKCKVVNRSFFPFRTVQAVRDAVARRQRVFAHGYIVKKQPLISREGEFPSGLLNIAFEFIVDKPHVIDDRRIVPEPQQGLFTLTLGLTPHQAQIDAVKAATSVKRGTISSCTASGKSIMMAMLINALGLRTLVVVPNLGLKNQLRDTFTKCFGNLDHITVENIDSPVLRTASKYDLLIIDEAHHVAAATYRELNRTVWKGIYYRFFFSGSPFRSKSSENILMESVAGQVVYKLGYQEAVKSGIVAPIEAYFFTLPKITCDGTTWREVYSELVVNRTDRNQLISDLISNLYGQGISTLCLSKEVNHGENIANITGCGFAHGEAPDCADLLSWFGSGKLRALVATEGVAGEGIDTKAAEYVLIAGLGKSKPAFMQKVGRVSRKYPGKESGKVILFKDPSHKFTLEHFESQCQYLRDEYGVEPMELTLPEQVVAA